jgi:hypothetical protein
MNGTLTFQEGSDVGCFMQLFVVNRGGLAAHPGQALLAAALSGRRQELGTKRIP